jgi:hypothetical protein
LIPWASKPYAVGIQHPEALVLRHLPHGHPAAACLLMVVALAACDGGQGTIPDGGAGDSTVPADLLDALASLPADTRPEALSDPGPEAWADAAPDATPDAPGDLPDGLIADAFFEDPCLVYECGDDGRGGSCGACAPLCGGTEPGPCVDHRCAVACCPSCGLRACGADGCGGLCGLCGEGTACEPVAGTCVGACDWATQRPTAWGPAGQVFDPRCSPDKAFNEARCFDVDGDGLGDNGLMGMCNQVTGTILPVDPATMPLVAVLDGVDDVLSAASFPLVLLPVLKDPLPPLPEGDVLALADGYLTASCSPRWVFPQARLEAGALSAGPVTLDAELNLAEGGPVLPLRIEQARLKGTVQPGGGPAGYAMEDGVFTGVVRKQTWQNALDLLQAACDAAPADAKPNWCAYLPVASSAIALMLDLHALPDGTFVPKSAVALADAGSLCLSLRLIPARVTGFAP